jgi:hypothetical protein
MKKVIIINGVARSGKDLFIEYYAKYSKHLVSNVSTVDKVKDLAKYMGWSGVKDDKSRKFLCDLKILWTDFNDYIFKDMLEFCLNTDGIIFIHCREPKEISRFKEALGDACVTLLIERPGIEIPNNIADKSVAGYSYDVKVYNDSTFEAYENKIKDLILRRII